MDQKLMESCGIPMFSSLYYNLDVLGFIPADKCDKDIFQNPPNFPAFISTPGKIRSMAAYVLAKSVCVLEIDYKTQFISNFFITTLISQKRGTCAMFVYDDPRSCAVRVVGRAEGNEENTFYGSITKAVDVFPHVDEKECNSLEFYRVFSFLARDYDLYIYEQFCHRTVLKSRMVTKSEEEQFLHDCFLSFCDTTPGCKTMTYDYMLERTDDIEAVIQVNTI